MRRGCSIHIKFVLHKHVTRYSTIQQRFKCMANIRVIAMRYKDLTQDQKDSVEKIDRPYSEPLDEWTDEQLTAEYFESQRLLDAKTVHSDVTNWRKRRATTDALVSRGYDTAREAADQNL